MDPATVGIRWLGVAGLELTIGDQILAIDPFFTRPPIWRLWFGRAPSDAGLVARHLPRCDQILVTHAHYDHAMDVPAAALQSGAPVYGSANTCRLMALAGVPREQLTQVAAGDRIDLGCAQVQVLPARHVPIPGSPVGPLDELGPPPWRLRDYRADVCLSYLIEAHGLRILDWSGVDGEGAPQADVLLVGLYAPRERMARLLTAVQPRLVIPVHWDAFFRPLGKPMRPLYTPPRLAVPPLQRMDPHQFARQVARVAPQARVLVPEALVRYDLGALGLR